MLLNEFTSNVLKGIENKKYSIFLIFYSFIILFFCSSFSPLYFFNNWPDVNVYYTIGKGLFFDKIPYKDLFDHKGPIIFFIYGFGYLLSPNSFLGMYILESISLFVSLYFIFKLSKLFLNRIWSFSIACFFPALLFPYIGFGGSAEEFILPFMFISLYFFINYFYSNSILHKSKIMFIHGIMIGITFFIKLNIIVFWFFPLLAIALILLFNKEFKSFIYNFFALVLGLLSVCILVVGYFLLNHAFSDFYEGYFVLNSKYSAVNQFSLHSVLSRVYVIFRNHLLSSFFVVVGVLFFSFGIPFKHKIAKVSIIVTFVLLLLLLFTSQAVILYYYIIYLVFAPLGLIALVLLLNKYFSLSTLNIKILSLTIICVSLVLSITEKKLFYYSFSDLYHRQNVFVTPQMVLAEAISSSTDKSLLCVGFNYHIDIFSLAEIVPNVKYFFTPNILYDYYPSLFEEQMSYIDKQLIQFVVIKDDYMYKSMFDQKLQTSSYIVKLQNQGFTLYELAL